MSEDTQKSQGLRKERIGEVVSDCQDKTIIIRVDRKTAHKKYKKILLRSKRFHAHDEENEAKMGDVVKIVETRPLSKLKRWRLKEVIRKTGL